MIAGIIAYHVRFPGRSRRVVYGLEEIGRRRRRRREQSCHGKREGRARPQREGAMANTMRVTLELGPKGKRVVAVAPDWPGLARGAKTEEAAIERLSVYVPRYAPVAKLA